MSANPTQNHCNFCAEVSKANGEDPIGSASPFDRWLIVETALPWPLKIWQEPKPIPPEVIELVNQIDSPEGQFRHLSKFCILAIAPDREYSQIGYTRVFHYHRPGYEAVINGQSTELTRLFAQYDKHEFIVPHALVWELVVALYQHEQLAKFEPYRQQTAHIRELMVCTHGNGKGNAEYSRLGYPIYRQLRSQYATPNQLRVWRCSYFGGHQFAPTLVDLPNGQGWGHLNPEILEVLVRRNQPVSQLKPYYRGNFGLEPFVQIVEREIWLREDWEWLEYLKAGEILEVDEAETQVLIRIDFISPEGVAGAYQATLEYSHSIISLCNSENEESQAVKQYEVTQLERIA